LLRLFRNEPARVAQRTAMTEALLRLGRGGRRPSLAAADAVLEEIGAAGPARKTN
jgi:hypothetical protein